MSLNLELLFFCQPPAAPIPVLPPLRPMRPDSEFFPDLDDEEAEDDVFWDEDEDFEDEDPIAEA